MADRNPPACFGKHLHSRARAITITVSGEVFQTTVQVCEIFFPPPLFIPYVRVQSQFERFYLCFQFSAESIRAPISPVATGSGSSLSTCSRGRTISRFQCGMRTAKTMPGTTCMSPSRGTGVIRRHGILPVSRYSPALRIRRLGSGIRCCRTELAGIEGNAARVDVSVNSKGQAVVAWNQDSQFVYAAVYSENTGWSHPEQISNTDTSVSPTRKLKSTRTETLSPPGITTRQFTVPTIVPSMVGCNRKSSIGNSIYGVR